MFKWDIFPSHTLFSSCQANDIRILPNSSRVSKHLLKRTFIKSIPQIFIARCELLRGTFISPCKTQKIYKMLIYYEILILLKFVAKILLFKTKNLKVQTKKSFIQICTNKGISAHKMLFKEDSLQKSILKQKEYALKLIF